MFWCNHAGVFVLEGIILMTLKIMTISVITVFWCIMQVLLLLRDNIKGRHGVVTGWTCIACSCYHSIDLTHS